MKRPDTWMPLYIGDYLRDTSRLTTEQHGAYLLLIMDCWVNGPLPDDDEALAAIVKAAAPTWRKMRPVMAGFFDIADGRWTHGRVERERAKAASNVEKRSEAGKKGAAGRWQTDGNRNANVNGERID